MTPESYYTKHMYLKDIAQWEAFHELDVYNDPKAQAVEDRLALRRARKMKVVK